MKNFKLATNSLMLLFVLICLANCTDNNKAEYWLSVENISIMGEQRKTVVIRSRQNDVEQVLDTLSAILYLPSGKVHHIQGDQLYTFFQTNGFGTMPPRIFQYSLNNYSGEAHSNIEIDEVNSICTCIFEENRARIYCPEGVEYVVNLNPLEVIDTVRYPMQKTVTPWHFLMDDSHLTSTPDIPKKRVQQNEALFWSIIEATRLRESGDRKAQLEALRHELSGLSSAELFWFNNLFHTLEDFACQWHLWCAAYIINEGCTEDEFKHFRTWLISQGKDRFYAALNDPNYIAVFGRKSEMCFFERFGDVAADVYKAKTGKSIPFTARSQVLGAHDIQWNENDVVRFNEWWPALFACFRDTSTTPKLLFPPEMPTI